MSGTIESVRVKGFRSLADLSIKNLPRVALLLGANGSGKSNLIQFFEMLGWMLDGRGLANYVSRHGGAGAQLFGRRDPALTIEAEIDLRTDDGRIDYRFVLERTKSDEFVFAQEAYRLGGLYGAISSPWKRIDGSGHREALIGETTSDGGDRSRTAHALIDFFRGLPVYHFRQAPAKSNPETGWDAADCACLRGDGANLAAILLRLEREDKPRLDKICRYIRLAVPMFERFEIEEKDGKAVFGWKQEDMEKTMSARMTSGGMLRFFTLVTLFGLPPEMLPTVLLLDDPDMSLHPVAVGVLGDLMSTVSMGRRVSGGRQVIAATQSSLLVDAFRLDDIVVLDLERKVYPRDGRTPVRRFTGAEYSALRDEYTTGELWRKNLLGGRP